ncbi:hypothetical protein E2C01_050733 [Portunus trituberculatus]|uniref:Uncharacterized protein n=1 Tax=Portunus trituberculatus TaxID=210409 RepID=A0A5B7GHR5_PORTR|nr:hypothetical protein [Portunus trituberculatus]
MSLPSTLLTHLYTKQVEEVDEVEREACSQDAWLVEKGTLRGGGGGRTFCYRFNEAAVVV